MNRLEQLPCFNNITEGIILNTVPFKFKSTMNVMLHIYLLFEELCFMYRVPIFFFSITINSDTGLSYFCSILLIIDRQIDGQTDRHMRTS